MKLRPHEFRVIVDDEDEIEFDDEAEIEAEVEGDEEDDEGELVEGDDSEEGDEEEEVLAVAVDDDRDEEAVDWEEAFEEATWNAPEAGELSFAKDLAEVIGAAMAEAMGALPDHKRPYTPHPKAAERDAIVTYDERLRENQESYARISGSIASESRAIANQLRRVLFTRSLNRSQHDQRRGRLDRRKLHTIATPRNLTPNKRIFTQKIEGETQNVAIGILVDQSGSMAGDKIINARTCAVAFGDALVQLEPLGVTFGVWGFDADHGRMAGSYADARKYDRYEPLRLHWYKGVDEDWRHVAPRVGQMHSLSDNIDGECVRWAAQQLLAVEGVHRRVLFVLSDGQPAGACPGMHSIRARLSADLKLAISQCEAAGVEMIGIGFLNQAVKNYYPKHTIISKADELGAKVLNLIANTFKVGGRGGGMIAIYFNDAGPDSLGRRHFTRYAPTTYLPGHPEGALKGAAQQLVSAQGFFCVPPTRAHVFESEPSADELRALFYGGAS